MRYTKIIGSGSYLPETILTNDDIAKKVDTTDEWIQKRVGIKQRHVIDESSSETTASMAEKAAIKALQSAGKMPSDIDLIIVATATPDNYSPSVACIVQGRLGISNQTPAFDVNAFCGGFVYALELINLQIKHNGVNTALVIGAESMSQLIDWTDRSTCVLFGDGAGAMVCCASDSPGILATALHADGRYHNNLYAKSSLWKKDSEASLYMHGKEVFKIATTKLGDVVDEILQKSGLKKSDVDWLIPHQANKRIIDATAKRIGLEASKVILTIENQGNTSSASVPLAFDTAFSEGKIKPGECIILEAFGGGYVWGAALLIL